MENAQASVDAPDDTRRARRRGAEGARGREARARRGAAPALAQAQAASRDGGGRSQSRVDRPRAVRRRRSRSATTIPATWSRRRRPTSSCASSIPSQAAGRRRRADSRSRARARSASPCACWCRAATKPERRQGPDAARRRSIRPASPPTSASPSTRRRSSPSARRCASRSSPSSGPTRSPCRSKRVIHEDDDDLRDGRRRPTSKAHKRKVDDRARPRRRTAEVTGGLKAGEPVIVQGQQGLPDGAAITHREMSLSASRRALRPRHSDRHGRSRGRGPADRRSRCRATSIRRSSSLASSSIGHSGTHAGADDDADRDAPARTGADGGAGHPPRALDDVPRRDGDLGAVRARRPTWSWRSSRRRASRRDPRRSLPADLELVVERLTPAAFPFLSVNLTGGLPPADLYDYAFYVMRPALSRVPASATSRCCRATPARSRSSPIRRGSPPPA